MLPAGMHTEFHEAGVKYEARITEIRQATPSIKTFRIEHGSEGFDFLPGQWIDLFAEVQGEQVVGGYSMTSAPEQRGSLELAIKYSESHTLTHHLHARAAVGDTVWISAGSGSFYYQRPMGDRVVLIGAGIGVTPMLSILRHIHRGEPEVSARLLYGVSVEEEILFRDELEAMARDNPRVRLMITVSQPSPDWSGLRGRIDVDKLREANLGSDSLYFLCGPPGMVEETAASLEDLGVPPARIRYEKWW